ncbi:MAG TPA: GtrA family protein [Gammaproteobacteria bacterium]|nr:GtrA family protein [Gammaproteobacteria bacterium]
MGARDGGRPPGLRKSFGLFVIAAAVGFALDAGVLTLLVRELHWSPWHGRFLSFPLAVTSTWLLNRRYAFRGAARRDGRIEYVAYWAIQLVGAAVNFGVFGLCLRAAPALAGWPFIPVAIGGVAAMLVNFALARSTVYRAPASGGG